MAGNVQDIELLIQLQEIDKNLDMAKEQIEGSPYIKKIEEVRAKKSEFKAKRDQIDKLYVKARKEFEEISNKDSELSEAQANTQKKIEKTQGDYRKVEDYTNKLNEISNNRKVIDKKLTTLESNVNKLKGMMDKIDSAIGKVSMAEDDLNEKLQSENANAQIIYNDNVDKKKKIVSQISPDAYEQYKSAREIVGNVVLATLNKNICSVCQNSFSPVTLDSIKKQAPISTCPNCQRLLVVN